MSGRLAEMSYWVNKVAAVAGGEAEVFPEFFQSIVSQIAL